MPRLLTLFLAVASVALVSCAPKLGNPTQAAAESSGATDVVALPRDASNASPEGGDANTAAAPSTSTVRLPDGSCDPMPRAGDPCLQGDGYCVLSWGSPGGASLALWCRDRRWELEEERNLPDE